MNGYQQRLRGLLMAAVALLLALVLAPVAAAARVAVTYDSTVLADSPVMYLTGSHVGSTTEPDASGHGHNASYLPAGSTWATTTLPNGDVAPDADGATQYMEASDASDLSVTTTGTLTVEAWFKADTLQFPHDELPGYVHVLAKGESGQQEYAFRVYSYKNGEGRPNRISAYQFNMTGGLGVGGYFQGDGKNTPLLDTTHWVHVVAVYTCSAVTHCPDGQVKWYRDGVLKQANSYTQTYATINNAGDGTSPFRVFARKDLASFFQGAVGKVAVYSKALTGTQINNHYQAMCPNGVNTSGCS